MLKNVILIICFFVAHHIFGQIKFDISKIKKTEIEALIKTTDSNTIYLEMKYGGHEFVKAIDPKKIENKIIKKIQYVYTDFPKDYDYSQLIFKRFASLYLELPFVFNKSWIEWEILKQTDCSSSAKASTMFHGFIITFKEGPQPNLFVNFPQAIQDTLKTINSSVEFIEIKSPDDLKKFLSTKEIKVNNIKSTDKNRSIKLFSQKNSGSFTIIDGLFLTTGIPQGAIGPNNSPSVTSVNGMGITPDKDLMKLVGKNSLLFDAAVVEFDIEVDADSLVFKYAFASEEYPEYLQFNDVFGLFITGKGLNNVAKDSTFNLATLDDKKTPISVSAINHLKNSEYYISNDYTTDLKLFKAWQYDGFTKVFTAGIKVKRKQKYHVKFAIADFGDPYYDSAIFIDAMGIKTKP